MRRFSFLAMAAAVAMLSSFGPAQAAENIGLVCTSRTRGDAQIAACNKIIAMKKFSGGQLAWLYFCVRSATTRKATTPTSSTTTEGLRITQ